jgi:hypothetical protein
MGSITAMFGSLLTFAIKANFLAVLQHLILRNWTALLRISLFGYDPKGTMPTKEARVDTLQHL